MKRSYEVIVIGGGHAGVEAAWAAANLLQQPGCVALITLDPSKIGEMSCNPAIGGLAKGQLVREIDAMGGLMGLVADATGIHFKVLNQSRGPAVRGPRCQSDKIAYAQTVRAMLAERSEIDVIAGSVDDLIIESGRCIGCVVSPPPLSQPLPMSTCGAREESERRSHAGELRSESPGESVAVRAPSTILTTGTFMRGLMHTGDDKTPGGRHGEAPAVGISSTLSRLGFELGRLKTGTPPRIRKDSIAWDELQADCGDATPTPFSDLTGSGFTGTGAAVADELAHAFPLLDQVECRQTSTVAAAHALIRDNLHRAPMYSGEIDATGPRYCPAIEDKVVRFPDRSSHGVFLEPESLQTDWIYCNGISSSLPADVQDRIVRSMPGCRGAHIYRHGYAVEYDMVRPHQIYATGMTKQYPGLFLAGQINGTSGYEEAAAQGLIAGINAVRHASGGAEFLVGRDQAYIGVLMDDLVTKTPREPYRMFTSRAEHRLLLRADNAADRLTPLANEIGLLGTALGEARVAVYSARRSEIDRLNGLMQDRRVEDVPLTEMVRRPEFGIDDLRRALQDADPAERALFSTLADHKYEPYIVRQRATIRRQQEIESKRLPANMDYSTLTAMRSEARLALERFRPATFGQAGRLEGVTPADITLLSVLLKRGG